MFDTTIDQYGFVEIIPETIRNPSPEDITQLLREVAIVPAHSRTEGTVIRQDHDLKAWVVDSPEGWLLLTSNAHSQLSARQRSSGRGGVVSFTVAKTDRGPVALGTGSDKYGLIQSAAVAERVARLMAHKRYDHNPREMVYSPAFVRVTYEAEQHDVAGDIISLGWGWQTSHDGSSSLRVFDRVERLVCANGLRATVNDEILKIRHVWGGMLSHHRRQLARSVDMALPESISDYLEKHSERKMELKADESILAAIDRQIDSGNFTIERARELAEKRYYDFEPAWIVARNALDWLTNPEHAKTLRDTLGLKQDLFKGLTAVQGREVALFQAVKANLQKYGEPHDYSAWSIVQALNDRQSLSRLPVSLQDAMESLSNSVLTNWEQFVQTVRPLA